MRGRRGAIPAVCLVLLAAAAGCGDSKLDTDGAESAIRKGISSKTGVRIASVTCPDEVDARQGDRFRCVARAANGQRAQVEVTQRDDKGNVSWRLVRRGR